MPSMRNAPSIILLLLTLLAVFLAYWPGLSGTFVFDDIANITRNTHIAITSLDMNSLKAAAFSGTSGPLMRPLSMLSFAANYYVTGPDPFYFKLTNLVIHLFNGVGVFVLTCLLLGFYRKRFEPGLYVTHTQWISLAVAAAWLLHPFNLTSVLYVVQRMTSLSALFSIWGLVVFLWGRTRLYDGKSGMLLILASLLLFTPLAALSKENGVLLPLLMLVAEVTLFSFHAEQAAARRLLIAFYMLAAAIPVIIALGYLAMHSDALLAGYKIRDFSLSERLMTEARVLWFYIGQILLPSNAQMGLYHDDIAISRGWFQPASTALAVAGVVALLALAFFARKKAPLIAFGVLFFFVGHVLESTILSLEIAHEHRNYLPMYGMLLMLFFYLLYPLKHLNNLRLRQIVAVLLIGLFAFNTFVRASKWANPYDQFQAEFEHHPDSVMVNVEMGGIYSNIVSPDPYAMETNYLAARGHYERAASLDRNDTKALFGLVMLNVSRGRAVEPGWVHELTHRLEAAPYAAITSDRLLDLTKCQLEGNCRLANNEFANLLQAALRNPALAGSNRAKVLYALSSYTINVLRDYPAALAIMQQMVQASPQEAAPRFALINFMIALRRYDEAKQQLDLLKRLDTLQDHSTEIKLLEQTLSDANNNEAHR